jgi:hypothetical protein
MIKSITLLAAAGFLAASTSFASAAPAPASAAQIHAGIAASAKGKVIKVHGRHRRCRRGRAGWHRHRWRRGDLRRIPCQPWYGHRRHRYERDCIKIGDFVRICPDD